MLPPLKKVMLIEDEKDIRTIAKISLEELGHFTVKFCDSGQEALREVVTFLPDLILLDVMMPEMDGVETFKALRLIPKVKEIPIIFMTAKVQASEITYYRELGAIDVVAKPFDPIQLPEVLREAWSSYHEQRSK